MTNYIDYGTTHGNRWMSETGSVRYYLPESLLSTLVSLTYTTYKTGNISAARLDGAPIANSKASKIRETLRFAKVWVDEETGTLHCQGCGAYESTIRASITAQLH